MLETELDPETLLKRCQEIELTIGRPSRRDVWKGPRVIDVDILFFEDLVFQTENLIIPHEKVQDRDFVLAPLRDFCPQWKHPILNRTIEVDI